MTAAVALPLVRTTTARGVQQISGKVTLRPGTPDDAGAIDDLIRDHLAEGHLLPRHLSELTVHARRFVVAVDDEQVIACGDLAPLSRTVAEVRSLVVSEMARSNGIGRQLIDALIDRAARAGFEKLCAFTHAPGYFAHLGFSIVPHEWLPEKIRTDCGTCSQFRRCGQYAVMLPLMHTQFFRLTGSAKATELRKPDATHARASFVPLAALHG